MVVVVDVLAVPGDSTYTKEALLVLGSPVLDWVELKMLNTLISSHQ